MLKLHVWKRRGAFCTRYSQALRKRRGALGVSATHLDWTMVPYVRKSFKKHLKDGFDYVETTPKVKELLDDEFEIPIDYPLFKNEYPKAYRYAYDMTKKEVYQAVEGLYHNLNVWATRQ